MMKFVKNFKFQSVTLEIKIGIHYGRVIAGVIGGHKPQFSLIGDTVNTTSRVCSTGIDNCITISEECYDELESLDCVKDFKPEKRVVEAKGKGLLTTYQVNYERKRNKNRKHLLS